MDAPASQSQVISYAGNALNREYLTYIASPEWASRRLVYYQHHPRTCAACDVNYGLIHLHHKTYERLGSERDSDLVTLCDKCHRSVHEAQRRSQASGRGRTLWTITERFVLHARAERRKRSNRGQGTPKTKESARNRSLLLMQKHLRAIQKLQRRSGSRGPAV